MQEKIIISERDKGKRIDQFLASYFAGKISRTRIQKYITQGTITVGDKCIRPHYIIKKNDHITVNYADTFEEDIKAEDMPLDVIYEDDDILVINKPAGMVVHPGAGNKEQTLVNALLFYTQGKIALKRNKSRPGIVHRLDKDTSGLLVIAKHDQAHTVLANNFKKQAILKVYRAIVTGVVQHDQGRCDQPIGRGRIFKKKMIVRPPDGKTALTEYSVVRRFANATLLNVKLLTGRTHQIRVHLAYLGHPVIGDKTYGHPSALINRQCLHASVLELPHPRTQRRMRFEAQLPADMKSVLQALESKL